MSDDINIREFDYQALRDNSLLPVEFGVTKINRILRCGYQKAAKILSHGVATGHLIKQQETGLYKFKEI